MLSRLSSCGGQNLAKCLIKFQPASAITTSAVFSAEAAQPAKDPSAYPPEFPPATSKRDFVNFPRLVVRDKAPPVRLGFIPESWFDFFYNKTGYTGPYMFILSVGTFLYSKEYIVYNGEIAHLYSLIIALMFAHYKFGPKIRELYTKKLEEQDKLWIDIQESEKVGLKNALTGLKEFKDLRGDVLQLLEGRKEFIYLQMEMHFRDRLVSVFKEVKNKLDCQAELENAERRLKQKNLYDYVINNVKKSITPDLENNVLQRCISDLNELATRA